MIEPVKLFLWFLGTLFKSRSELEAEILALRHQVHVLHRLAPTRLRLYDIDRLLFVWLYRLTSDRDQSSGNLFSYVDLD